MRSKVFFISIILSIVTVFHAAGDTAYPIIVDSLTNLPLSSATIFDNRGNVIGISDTRGRAGHVFPNSYPLTVRYLGFKETRVSSPADTIFMVENPMELNEVIVQSQQQKVLHVLAYVREYSTLTSYTDTVFLFREKMVDYMLNSNPKVKFNDWRVPRILKSRSYYRFTNLQGLDSVSDNCSNHFSWADWIGIAPSPVMPAGLHGREEATDTVYGRYSPAEVWLKNRDQLTVDINVLSDTAGRRWVPNLEVFFRNGLDFENFRLRYNYDSVLGDSVSVADITGYTFNIASRGRGHNMFMFNRQDQPFFVNTFAEVYILDKEYITLKEARKWAKRQFNTDEMVILEPESAPELQPYIVDLVDRVNAIDSDEIRLANTPDERLVGRKVAHYDIAHRALNLLKTITGISRVRAERKWKNNWKQFRREQTELNQRARRSQPENEEPAEEANTSK